MTRPTTVPHRRALGALCLTVFTDLLAFGIILPLLPYVAAEFGASGTGIGLLFAAYSLAQFLAAPLLGAASDRFGRKPLLLVALTGSALSLALTAMADSLAALIAARAMAGACGGSIGIAHAFAADLAPPGQRTRVLGMVGASVGLGFAAGPALGAALAGTGLAGASAVAACVAAAALILAAFTLPATPPPPPQAERHRRARTRASARLRTLLAAGFATTAAFTAMEATLALLGADRHGLTPAGLGWLLASAALALTVVQGVLTGPLARRFPARHLATAGAATMALGLALLPLTPSASFVLALLALSAGYGLATPALATLVAEAAPGRTGAAMGATQSAAALARATAPAAAGAAYDAGPTWTYIAAATLAALTALALTRQRPAPHPPHSQRPTSAEPGPAGR